MGNKNKTPAVMLKQLKLGTLGFKTNPSMQTQRFSSVNAGDAGLIRPGG